MTSPLKTLTRIALALAALLVPPPATAFELPDIGDPSGAALSPEQERQIGEATLRQLRRYAKLVSDPEVEAFIQSIGFRLVAQSDDNTQPFEFFLVEDPSINAFAAPGGFVGMHTGTLLVAENESELAGVLAHEIAHVTQKHMARTFEKASQLSLPMAAAMLGAILLGTQNPQAGQAAIAAVAAGNAQIQIDFTRSHEEEADRVGMQLLARAGFDPRGMPEFFERLQMANRLTDNAQLPEFLRTHPVTISRIADSRNRAEQYPRRPYKNSLGFQLARAKLRVTSTENPIEALSYFEHLLRHGGPSEQTAAHYGYALALLAARQYDKARAELGDLRRADPDQVAYLLAAAETETAQGRLAQGLRIYADSLAVYPDYRPVVLGYSRALLIASQPDQARKVLRDYARQHPPDIAYYALLAEAEGKSGSQVEAHIAMAERDYLSGDTKLAREQLKFAQRDRGVDHFQRQRIEARLEVIDKELEEDRKKRSRW